MNTIQKDTFEYEPIIFGTRLGAHKYKESLLYICTKSCTENIFS